MMLFIQIFVVILMAFEINGHPHKKGICLCISTVTISILQLIIPIKVILFKNHQSSIIRPVVKVYFFICLFNDSEACEDD